MPLPGKKARSSTASPGKVPGRCQFTAELLRDPAAAPVGEGIEVTALLSFRWRILEEAETAVIQQVLLGEPRQADPNEPSVILPGRPSWGGPLGRCQGIPHDG